MDAKQEIKLTIFRLIHERGYDKTTYQVIADMSGYEKTLVQYHFPKKTLFMIIYIDFLVSVINDYIGENKMTPNENELDFILSSKIYTHILLHEEIIDNVTAKIVGDRNMLTKIQDVHEESAIKTFKVKEESVEEFRLLLRFAQGGHYEILHRMINENMPCDIHQLLKITLLTISPALKITQNDVYRIMDESLEYEESIQKAVRKIVGSVKSQLGIVSFD